MEWKDEYSVGISAIDQEHQVLVEYVSDIEYAIESSDRQAVEAAIGRLASFAVTHFSFEETLMQVQRYEDVKAHVEGHKSFLATLNSLQDKYRDEAVSNGTLEALHTWLAQHFTGDDKLYASSLAPKDRDWMDKYFPS